MVWLSLSQRRRPAGYGWNLFPTKHSCLDVSWQQAYCISYILRAFHAKLEIFLGPLKFRINHTIDGTLVSLMYFVCEKSNLCWRGLKKFQFSPEESSHVYHVQNKAISPFATHHNDVIMGTMAFQITSLTIVYPTVYSGADRRKHQSSASLAFVQGIHRRPVNSPHKCPVTQKMFPFDDVIVRYMYIASFMATIGACGEILLLFTFEDSDERHGRETDQHHSMPYVILWKGFYIDQGTYVSLGPGCLMFSL